MPWFPTILTFRAFIRLQDGRVTPWTESLTVPTALTLTARTVSIPAGELLSFACTSSTPALLNELSQFVRVEIYFGQFALNHLVARIMGDYLRSGIASGLPLTEPKNVFEGNQGLTIVPFTNPAPGASMVYTVVGFGMETLEFVRFRVVTDANVINRLALLAITPLAGASRWFYYLTAIPAGVERALQFSSGQPTEDVVQGVVNVRFPKLGIGPGTVITCRVNNVQVGDQISVGEMGGRVWLNC